MCQFDTRIKYENITNLITIMSDIKEDNSKVNETIIKILQDREPQKEKLLRPVHIHV